ncbi:unnamed protein product [Adineta ricciae]|uniref:NAD(P)(+)--arginine ADP-ribosyltransferase n=1 Tax=Adineta ricciae TaxID=249248 RepID=A0A815JGE4_ADIRI|nr:unnamed protein product [Adineta ricciae]CAF1377566.1 unnamed protein product [Adineta ricciae]
MSNLREDRFFIEIPFVSQKQFYHSEFLKHYDQTVRHPAKYDVINSLKSLPFNYGNTHLVHKAIADEPEEHDVIRTYTSDLEYGNQSFYAFVNKQLANDAGHILVKLMPLIRRATFQINYKPPLNECVVYRCMRLTNKQKEHFKTNTVFRFPGFTSTSKSKTAAKKFGSVLFEIHIPAGCKQVRNIAAISHFKDEEEYVFSPYSLFKVTGRTLECIILKAIDNKSNIGMDDPSPADKPSILLADEPMLTDAAKPTPKPNRNKSSACVIL